MKSNFLIAGIMTGIMTVSIPVTAFATTMVPSFELPSEDAGESVGAEAPSLPEAGGTVPENALPQGEQSTCASRS